jgi:hypothetical protein
MASAKKKALARGAVEFRDLNSTRDPKGGVKLEPRVKTG